MLQLWFAFVVGLGPSALRRFRFPFQWFAFGVGLGLYACAAVSDVQIVGSRLVLVVVLRVWRWFWSLCVRLFGFICSFVRRLALLDPVEIWRKSA